MDDYKENFNLEQIFKDYRDKEITKDIFNMNHVCKNKYNLSKITIFIIYFLLPISIAFLLYFLNYNIFYFFINVIWIYQLFVYVLPISLRNEYSKWELQEGKIIYYDDIKSFKLLIPFKLLFKKRIKKELKISDISNITLSFESNAYHTDREFALNAWSTKFFPSLQTEYQLELETTQKIKLVNKDFKLVLDTVYTLLKNDKIIKVK